MTNEASQPDALARHILSLADTKRLLGVRYSDWLLGAPSIETGIAASSMCQDEWGHARLLYAMLKDFGYEPFEIEHERPADRYYSAPALDEPFADWADFVAGVIVVDGALAVALQSFGGGAFELARSRIPKMLAEEEFHRAFGDGWVATLADGTADAKARLKDAVSAMAPSTLAWLCPDDDVYAGLVEDGMVDTLEAVRAGFDARLKGPLALLDLDASSLEADREGWDSERRRGPGAPAEEAVERARGDKNRALFVE